jgi:triacylglycerol lipase
VSTLVEFPFELFNPTAFKGFTAKTDFDLGNARAMMWMSQLAYETHRPEKIEKVRKLWEFDRVTPFVDAAIGPQAFDTRGIIAEGNGVVILAFAGTDPAVWQNLASDFLQFVPSKNDTWSGFQTAADGARARVQDAMDKSRALGRPLFVAGHSLGAAIAVLAAEQAFDGAVEPAAIYVFGMPRTGGKTFRDRYNGKLGLKTYRLIHGLDVVARIPNSGIGFHHVGRMLSCAHDQKFNRNASLSGTDSNDPKFDKGIAQTLSVGVESLLTGNFLSPVGPGPFGPLFQFLPKPIRDHLQDRYLNALDV